MFINSLDEAHLFGIKRKTSKNKPVRRQEETEEQAALIEWAGLATVNGIRPGEFLIHIVNEGKRGPKAARDAKRMGLRKGIPDLLLALPRAGYAGLWIEMKSKTGRLTTDQKEWNERLNNVGYRAVICYRFEAAKCEIENYLKLERTI